MTGARSTTAVAGPGGPLHGRVEGEGPVLILLTGGPGNADALAGLIAALAGPYTVVTHDRRGYSRSPLDDSAAPVDLEDHAADVVAVLDGLGVELALLFGSSIGGAIGFGDGRAGSGADHRGGHPRAATAPAARR